MKRKGEVKRYESLFGTRSDVVMYVIHHKPPYKWQVVAGVRSWLFKDRQQANAKFEQLMQVDKDWYLRQLVLEVKADLKEMGVGV